MISNINSDVLDSRSNFITSYGRGEKFISNTFLGFITVLYNKCRKITSNIRRYIP